MSDQRTLAEIETDKSKIGEIWAFVQSFVITSDDDFHFASDILKSAKTVEKEIEQKRVSVTKPILDAKRNADALFKPNLDKLKEIDAVLRKKIGDYLARVEAERVAVMHKSAETFNAGGTPVEIIPERPEAKGISSRAVWAFEVTDPDLVPRQFCSPDVDKIKASRDWSAYNEHFPPPPIPGIRFFQEQKVRVRT